MQSKSCAVNGCKNIVSARNMCQTHYKRWKRHGHVLDTRECDWGARTSHPLYKTWHWVIRTRTAKNTLDERWKDFWNFVEDVKERPEKTRLCARDDAMPLGKNNWYWKELEPSIRDEKQRQYARDWMRKKRLSDPEFHFAANLKKHYGLTVEQYSTMHEAQNGVCAICKLPESAVVSKSGKKRRLAVDHCHTTGKIRGLLCSLCNRGLGAFKDSAANLQSAIEYLKL